MKLSLENLRRLLIKAYFIYSVILVWIPCLGREWGPGLLELTFHQLQSKQLSPFRTSWI